MNQAVGWTGPTCWRGRLGDNRTRRQKSTTQRCSVVLRELVAVASGPITHVSQMDAHAQRRADAETIATLRCKRPPRWPRWPLHEAVRGDRDAGPACVAGTRHRRASLRGFAGWVRCVHAPLLARWGWM